MSSLNIFLRGNERMDAAIGLGGTGSQPLADGLRDTCRRAAKILCADVVSVYLREVSADGEHDDVVMRANVGFPTGAVDTVRLAFGEGITGFVAEIERPVSCVVAGNDPHFVEVLSLDEHRFPCYAGVPLFVGEQVIGVLVAQRGPGRPFSVDDITLALALGHTVASQVLFAELAVHLDLRSL